MKVQLRVCLSSFPRNSNETHTTYLWLSGQWEEIGGVKSYVSIPPGGEYAKDTVILFLADLFGPQFINAQLLVDGFAKNGYKVVAPDYFNGDPAPEDALNPGVNFDVMKWFANHGPEQTRPPLDNVLAALKEQGIKKIGATGYCFGGRYVFDLAFENITDVSVVSHPTFIKAPEDLEKYLEVSEAPLLINSCTFDERFPPESQAIADQVLGDGKFTPGYKREYFEGCTHGFAVRGDMNDPKVKAAKEGAFNSAVTWFKTKL
ncbi:hypothetical protein EST38_g6005 [Candolleomyces aberdarensis]|uniref:Dienelactone hydrolase domain-containing protein n=1 Tax=Candolleomyces aberdarensis TaxID=2316362 RepID=A0A4Q2DIW8_9AGAR|nr:hypothetical protein EST38_g6005 [Candolleomyces aberdarensis]